MAMLLLLSFAGMAQCISTFPHTEGFESAPTWTAAGTNSDWAWGAPAHASINTAGGGTKSWCIGNLTGAFYNLGELSTLTSPCYDLTSLSYPWISFKIYWECEYKWDGMVLQSSINNGVTWTNVGAFGDPSDCNTANWYNYNNITNLTSVPASQRHGWTGRVGPTSGSCSGGNGSGGWVVAKHCLTGLANQSNVKFRFLFGSGTTCNNYDGIAIDDILISNGAPNVSTFTMSCNGAGSFGFTSINTSTCNTSPTYAWNFGDPTSGAQNVSSSANQTHTFSASGTYTVRLIVSGGQCNPPDTSYKVVTVGNGSVNSNVQNVTCYGQSNGSATVSVVGAGPCTYTWVPNGGNAAIATNLSAGNYSVLIHDSGNCPYSKSLSITQPSPLTGSVSSTSGGCSLSSSSATVAASGGVGPYSYSWSPGGGTSANISNITPGTYSVKVTDANGCSSTYTTSITIVTTLSAQVNGIQLCKGQSGVLTASVNGGAAPYTYVWNGVVANSTLAVSGSSSTVYTLNVTDKNGCSSLPDTAGLNVLAPISISLVAPDSVCPGAAVLSATASGGTGNYSFTWLPQNSSASTLSLNVTSPQSYSLQVSDGCTVPDANVSGLINLYTVPSSAFVADHTSGCQPLCIGFSDAAVNPNQILNWNWSFGDQHSSTDPAPQHCYAKAGTYTVSLNYTTVNGCKGSQTIADYIHVFPQPLAEFNTSTTETDIYNANVEFYNYSQNAISYQWFLASGANIGNEKNLDYAFVSEGEYVIFLIAKSDQGCADTASRVIKIDPVFTFYAPDAFTPNDDNLNDIFTPKGSGWDASNFEMSIFDRWGEMIFHTRHADEGWNGKIRNVLAENGTYTWKAVLRDVQAQKHEYVGRVLLMK